MITQMQITVEGRTAPFTLDWQTLRWESLERQKESDFPLIAMIDGKRYELYSSGTFAEVER